MKFVTPVGGMGSPTSIRLSSSLRHLTTNCKRNLSKELDEYVSCTTDDESCAGGSFLTPRTPSPIRERWPMLSSPAQQQHVTNSPPSIQKINKLTDNCKVILSPLRVQRITTPKGTRMTLDRHSGNKLTPNDTVLLSPPSVQLITEPEATLGRHTGNQSTQNSNASLQSPKRKRNDDDDDKDESGNDNGKTPDHQEHLFENMSTEILKYPVGRQNVKTSTPVQNSAVSRRIQDLRDEGHITDRGSDGECLYPCHECGKTFDGLLDLTDHTLEHSNEKSYECDLCGEFVTTKKELKKHNKTCHSEERLCDQCGKAFTNAKSLESHKKKHHFENFVNISMEESNDIEGSQNEDVANRILEDSDKKSYRCDLCAEFFATKKELKKHNKTCHCEERQCDQCDKVLISAETLENHKNKYHFENIVNISTQISEDSGGSQNEGIGKTIPEHSDKKSYECDLCGEFFERKKVLKKHNKACHCQERQCDQCGKVVISAEALESHKEGCGARHEEESENCSETCNSKELELECDQCGETFNSAESLDSHKKTHQFENTVDISTENTVDISTAISNDAERIQNEEIVNKTQKFSGKTSLQCALCGDFFAARKELKKHNKTCDSKERQCDQCGKVVISAEALESHKEGCRARHEEESENHSKEMECDQCGETFNSAESLDTHKMIHQFENNADISSENNLDISTEMSNDAGGSHDEAIAKRTPEHSGKTSLQCALCGEFFAAKKKLKKHNKTCHSKERQCDQCGKSLTSVEALDNHRKKCGACHGEKMKRHNKTSASMVRQCDQCGKSFKSVEALESHKKKRGAQHSRTSYQCKECGSNFFKKRELKIHRAQHITGDSYTCTRCKETFKERQTFLVHREKHRKTYQCGKCDHSASKSSHLSAHIASVHEGIKLHKCKICDKLVETKYNLKRHMVSKHSKKVMDDEKTEKDNIHECSSCNKTFKTKLNLKMHQKLFGEKRLKCAQCSFPFHRRVDMMKHMRRMHNAAAAQNQNRDKDSSSRDQAGVEPNLSILEDSQTEDESSTEEGTREQSFPCKDCDVVFSLKSDLHKHRWKSHPVQRRHHCNLCYKSFKKKSHLDEHKEIHSGKREQCKFCDKFFDRERDLRKHVKTFHSNNPSVDTKHVCEECGASFKKKKYLDTHIRRLHTENNPIKCDQCDKSFMCKSELTKHQSVHGAVKLFSCDLCGKSFAQKNTLTQHRATHNEGVKLFSCNLCDKSFSQRSQLTNHSKDHIKPFACNLCDKSFSRKYNLTRHSALHNSVEVEVLSCNTCGKSFNRKDSLTRHIAYHEEAENSGNVSKQTTNEESESVDVSNSSERFQTNTKRRKPAQLSPDRGNRTIQDCEICGKWFWTKHHLDKHMKRAHEGFHDSNSDTSFEINQTQNSSQKPIMDTKSNKQKTSSKNAAISRNGNLFQCNKCKRAFSHEVTLKRHMRLHFPRAKDPHACTECMKMYEDKSHWKMHMREVHNKATE